MSEERDWTRLAKKITIHAPGEKVWEALSNQDDLQKWMGERVVLEPKVRGWFALWGRGTYGSAVPLETPGKVIAFDRLTRLGLQFIFKGFTVRQIITIDEADPSTTVRVEYELPENALPSHWYLAQDHAILLLYNLRSYAESGRSCVLPDAPSVERTVHLSALIAAQASEVFAALTVPVIMDKWISAAAKVDLRPGGIYSFGWVETKPDGTLAPMGAARVIEVEPGVLLKHSWQHSMEAPTQVEWRVEQEGMLTKVSLSHSGFAAEDDYPGYVQGWAAFLCILKALLEGKSKVEDA